MKYLYLFIPFLFIALSGNAQTAGQLTVSVTTSSAGGSYAPKHILAIWIEDEQGHFVKTLLAYANTRKTHLNTWQSSTKTAGSEYNTTDAITGATQPSHSTRTCTWDGTDYNGNLLNDGSYSLHLELTDKNATGNHKSIPFTKSAQNSNLSPSNSSSFSSITVSWAPDNASLSEEKRVLSTVFPNPSAGLFFINTEEDVLIEAYSITGKSILQTKGKSIDLSSFTNGVYFIKTTMATSSTLTKVIKY